MIFLLSMFNKNEQIHCFVWYDKQNNIILQHENY